MFKQTFFKNHVGFVLKLPFGSQFFVPRAVMSFLSVCWFLLVQLPSCVDELRFNPCGYPATHQQSYKYVTSNSTSQGINNRAKYKFATKKSELVK